MNYNQNKKIMKINEQTLIVGADIAKEKHVARSLDFRGIEYSKTLSFTNNNRGFVEFYNWFTKKAKNMLKITHSGYGTYKTLLALLSKVS